LAVARGHVRTLLSLHAVEEFAFAPSFAVSRARSRPLSDDFRGERGFAASHSEPAAWCHASDGLKNRVGALNTAAARIAAEPVGFVRAGLGRSPA